MERDLVVLNRLYGRLCCNWGNGFLMGTTAVDVLLFDLYSLRMFITLFYTSGSTNFMTTRFSAYIRPASELETHSLSL